MKNEYEKCIFLCKSCYLLKHRMNSFMDGIKETNHLDVFNIILFPRKKNHTGMLVYGWIYEIHALMIFKATDSKSNVFNWPVMGQSQILTDITYMEERDECMAMKKTVSYLHKTVDVHCPELMLFVTRWKLSLCSSNFIFLAHHHIMLSRRHRY